MRSTMRSLLSGRKFGRHLVALLVAPMLLAGTAVVTTPPKPVEAATFCGFNSWTLTYHDAQAWWVNAVGYDQNGNQQSVWIYTYLASTRDNNHCWLENSTMDFYWYDNVGGYLSHTSKQLLTLCQNPWTITMWCYGPWSGPSQVYGP